MKQPLQFLITTLTLLFFIPAKKLTATLNTLLPMTNNSKSTAREKSKQRITNLRTKCRLKIRAFRLARRKTRKVVVLHTSTSNPSKLFIDFNIEGNTVQGQIDTGAEVSLIPWEIFRTLPNKDSYTDHGAPVILLDHNKRPIQQRIPPKLIPITVGDKTYHHEFYISNIRDNTSCLLGMDIINKMKLNINHHEEGVKITLGTKEIPSTKVNEGPGTLQSIEAVTIDPGEEKEVKCTTTSNIADGMYLLQQNDDSPIQLTDNMKDIKHDAALVTVRNINSVPLTVSPNTPLATIMSANEEKSINNVSHPLNTHLPTLSEIPGTEPASLPFPGHEKKYSLKETLEQSKTFPKELIDPFVTFVEKETPDLISKSEYDIGLAKIDEEMEIELTTDQPITSKPYVLDNIRSQQLTKAMEELVRQGIFKKGHSPYSSSLFMVTKAKDSQGIERLRVVADYRKLNAKTKRLNFPMPNIQMTLQSLVGFDFYSSVDLSSAFLSLKMSEEASKRAAVSTSDCVYLPTRCFFGLANSPTFFAKVIREVLGDLECIRYYQDDILIVTRGSAEQHLKDIQTVFRRLAKYGMKINGKGSYYQTSLPFLGKIVDRFGCRPLPKHVEALQNHPRPTNRKEVMRFNGICNWLCPFIPNYSKLMKPLNELLSIKDFNWTDEHEASFQTLKDSITQSSFLFHVDQDEPLYLASDISDSDWAALLYQVKSYDRSDIPMLQKQSELMREFPSSTIKTQHPCIPKEGRGVPPPQKMYGQSSDSETSDIEEDPEKLKRQKTANHPRAHLTPSPSLTELLGETDKVHLVRAIGFFSGVFKGPQARYSTLEKETTAVLMAIDHFKYFLRNSKHTYILSDSQAMIWLTRFRNAGLHKLERMITKLYSYSFKIIVCHLRGLSNIADKFTRVHVYPKVPTIRPCEAKKSIVVETPFPVGSIVTPDEIIQKLEQTPDIVQIPPRVQRPRQKCTNDNLLQHDLPVDSDMEGLISDVNKHIDINATTTFSLTKDLHTLLDPSNIIKEQRKHQETNEIIEKLLQNDEGTQERFLLDKGVLKKRSKSDTTNIDEAKIVIPPVLEGTVLAFLHLNNHCGGSRLAHKESQGKGKYVRFRMCTL